MEEKLEFKVEKVRGLMAEHKDSQEKLAEVLGVSRNTVANKLNGTSDFTASEISVLSTYYKVEVSYFFS